MDAGADLHAKTYTKGQTPLHYACVNGRTETAVALVRRGADAHLPDATPGGRTPCDTCEDCGHRPTLNAVLFASTVKRREVEHQDALTRQAHVVQVNKVNKLEVERRKLLKSLQCAQDIEQALLVKHRHIHTNLEAAREGQQRAIERARKNQAERVKKESKDNASKVRRRISQRISRCMSRSRSRWRRRDRDTRTVSSRNATHRHSPPLTATHRHSTSPYPGQRTAAIDRTDTGRGRDMGERACVIEVCLRSRVSLRGWPPSPM